MHSFALIPLLAALFNVLLAGVVFLGATRTRAHQLFAIWTLCLAAWNIGAWSIFKATTPDVALLLARLTHVPVVFLPPLFLHITLILTRAQYRRSLLIAAYVAAACFAVTASTDLFVASVRRVSYAWFSMPGPAYFVFANVYFSAVVGPALYLQLKHYRNGGVEQKRRSRTMVIASCMIVISGAHDMLPVFGFDHYPGTQAIVYPWGEFACAIYAMLVAIAILHGEVSELRVFLGARTASASRFFLLISISSCLLVIVAVTTPLALHLPTLAVCFSVLAVSSVATAFLYHRFGEGTSSTIERKLLGDAFEYQQHATRFIQRIDRYSNVETLVHDATEMLRESMGFRTAHLVLITDTTGGRHVRIAGSSDSSTPWDQAVSKRDAFLEKLTTTKAAYLDLRSDTANGTERPFPDFVFPIGHDDRISALLLVVGRGPGRMMTSLDIAVLKDLTTRLGVTIERLRLAERVSTSEKYALLSDMASGLAHDLNNLLSPVSAFLQTCSPPSGSDESQLHDLAVVKLRTIRDYIDEAMFFARTLRINAAPCSIAHVFSAVRNSCEARANSASVVLRFSIDPPTPQTLIADIVLVERLLVNLVNNAIDASPGGSCVEIKALPTPHAHERIRLAVIDAGHGISKEFRGRVFEPYFTTKNTGDGRRGSGLGLTIAGRIVDLHHGTITLKSAQGAGTTVEVDLPIAPEPRTMTPA